MSQLKLIALDQDDLVVISAAMQDAVLKTSDLDYDPTSGQFFLAANRFVWEQVGRKKKRTHERRRANIAFKRVEGVKLRGVDRSKPDEVLSLLSIEFKTDKEGPEGKIELTMSGGAGILLDVECLEVQLTDTGAAWETKYMPKHGI